ncbi:hypothetical protein N9Y89_01665 [bacterium]|nr:hypothetical protein [bacterium]
MVYGNIPNIVFNVTVVGCKGFWYIRPIRPVASSYIFKSIIENYPTTYEGYDAWRNYVMSFGLGNWLNNDLPTRILGDEDLSFEYEMYGQRINYLHILCLQTLAGNDTPIEVEQGACPSSVFTIYQLPAMNYDPTSPSIVLVW